MEFFIGQGRKKPATELENYAMTPHSAERHSIFG